LTKLISWQCKCGAVYALEPKEPTVLHEKVPDRKKCQKEVGKNKKCNTPFPTQEERNKMFKQQFGIIEE
jgi:hypothetical protein